MLVTNVNVVVPDGVLDDCAVRVRDKQIDAIGELRALTEEIVIDGRGGYLSPGFIELHMHLGYLGLQYPLDAEMKLCAENLPKRGTTRYLGTLISALQGD